MEKDNEVYGKIFPVFDRGKEKSDDTKSGAEYDRLYRKAAQDPEAFWANGTRCLTWTEANERLRALIASDNRAN